MHFANRIITKTMLLCRRSLRKVGSSGCASNIEPEKEEWNADRLELSGARSGEARSAKDDALDRRYGKRRCPPQRKALHGRSSGADHSQGCRTAAPSASGGRARGSHPVGAQTRCAGVYTL